MTDMVRVSFACNNPNSGNPTHRFDMAEFRTDDDCMVSLSGPSVAIEWGSRGTWVRVADAVFRTPISDYKPFEGNWCWDGCSMDLEYARVLLRRLGRIGFRPDEYTLEGPFADVVQEFA